MRGESEIRKLSGDESFPRSVIVESKKLILYFIGLVVNATNGNSVIFIFFPVNSKQLLSGPSFIYFDVAYLPHFRRFIVAKAAGPVSITRSIGYIRYLFYVLIRRERVKYELIWSCLCGLHFFFFLPGVRKLSIHERLWQSSPEH